MFNIKSKKRAFSASLCLTLLVALVTQLHVRINYPPELHALVLPRASLAAIGVTFPITLVVAFQAMKNWKLSEELRRLVSRDRLTNVATRDFFFERLSGNPNGYGLSLMVDIDFFKRVNDTYGHLIGDKVITQVAHRIRDNIRPQDIVCRFGGEEFVVFLAKADEGQAFEIAENIRKAVEAATMELDPSDPSVAVTVSIGGSLRAASSEIETAINQADVALYQAKALGRNRTVMAQSAWE